MRKDGGVNFYYNLGNGMWYKIKIASVKNFSNISFKYSIQRMFYDHLLLKEQFFHIKILVTV